MSEYKYIPPKPPLSFTVLWCALYGAIVGFLTARGNMQLALLLIILGALIFSMIASFAVLVIKDINLSRIFCLAILGFAGFFYIGLSYGFLMAVMGFILGHLAIWISSGN